MKLVGSSTRVMLSWIAIAGLVFVHGARAEDEVSDPDGDACFDACEVDESECRADCIEADDPEICEESCDEEVDTCFDACE